MRQLDHPNLVEITDCELDNSHPLGSKFFPDQRLESVTKLKKELETISNLAQTKFQKKYKEIL